MLEYEISVEDVRRAIEAGDAVSLIDVREPMEYSICSLDGSELIPMNTVPQRVSYLDEKAEDSRLIVYCHHGMRSMNVVAWLRQQGVENCQSMAGGIDAWSLRIDPAVSRY